MKPDSNSMLKFAFILGAVVDGAIAVSWFLIASGVSIPNILNGYVVSCHGRVPCACHGVGPM